MDELESTADHESVRGERGAENEVIGRRGVGRRRDREVEAGDDGGEVADGVA